MRRREMIPPVSPNASLQARSGADTIIETLVQGIPDADSGFTLLFSASPFPGYQAAFEWRREEMGGNWYFSPDLNAED